VPRSFFDQIVIVKTWNARYGGVYVPVVEDTQSNPYLAVPVRDIIISQDLTLTKINPSYMTSDVFFEFNLNGKRMISSVVLPRG
jgi:hypothetical protein